MNITVKQILSWINWQDTFRDLYPNYSNEQDINKFEDEYYFETKKAALDTARNILGTFEALEAMPLIPIYRAMNVRYVNELDYEFLGDHWSWDLNSATKFGRMANANIIIHALTPPSNVEWKLSVLAYLEFSLDDMSDEAENELLIKDSIPLKVLKITNLNGKILNV